MATALRMKRIGAKKAPVYRIIATDSRKRRDGRSIEELGVYDPRQNPPAIELNIERTQHWLDTGAVPSDTVRSILRKAGFFRPEEISIDGTPKLQRDPSVIAGERNEPAPKEIHQVPDMPEPVSPKAEAPAEAAPEAESAEPTPAEEPVSEEE